MVASNAVYLNPANDLSEASIKKALDSLLRTYSDPVSSPLENLQIVEEVLLASGSPQSSQSRRYVVRSVLVSLIEDEWHQLQAGFELSPTDSDSSRSAALETLRQAAAKVSPELLSWCWLYYHYVRFDLGITHTVFCTTASIHVRCIPRYQQRAIRRLLFRLLEREQAARQTSARRHLLARLPSPMAPFVIGRDAELKAISPPSLDWSPRHFQVIGAPGTGKTALVRQAICSQVNRDALDNLLWLEAPESVQTVRQQLTEWLYNQQIRVTIRDYLLNRRTVIVLDQAESLANDLPALEALLNELSPALVFITSRRALRVPNMACYLVLGALPEGDAKRLIRALIDKWYIQGQSWIGQQDIQEVWEAAGGNPGTIEQAVLEFCEAEADLQSGDGRLFRPHRIKQARLESRKRLYRRQSMLN